MKTISITISKKAYDNLQRFVNDENMTESKVIETLLTWEVPPHCVDMVVGDGSRKGDGTFSALTFEYRYLTLTDLHREDYEAKIKELSKVTDHEGLKNLGYKLVRFENPSILLVGSAVAVKRYSMLGNSKNHFPTAYFLFVIHAVTEKSGNMTDEERAWIAICKQARQYSEKGQL